MGLVLLWKSPSLFVAHITSLCIVALNILAVTRKKNPICHHYQIYGEQTQRKSSSKYLEDISDEHLTT